MVKYVSRMAEQSMRKVGFKVQSPIFKSIFKQPFQCTGCSSRHPWRCSTHSPRDLTQAWSQGHKMSTATQGPVFKGPVLGSVLCCHCLEILNNLTVESIFFNEIQWNKTEQWIEIQWIQCEQRRYGKCAGPCSLLPGSHLASGSAHGVQKSDGQLQSRCSSNVPGYVRLFCTVVIRWQTKIKKLKVRVPCRSSPVVSTISNKTWYHSPSPKIVILLTST